MTTTFTETPQSIDADLVARSLAGDREAFATIVARHQSVICAITYAACGDLHQSEDLAQETFVAAWKGLGDLKDPEHLRAWLRGIARNIIASAMRKQNRAPVVNAQPNDDRLQSASPGPVDDAISDEEHALLWQNLSQLPEDYREPLVLFYREGESVNAVAEAMEISPEAARMRLSRGRAMLAKRIEHLIDRGLRKSGPGKTFTLAVVAALPAIAIARSAAALGATAATGGAVAKTSFTLSSLSGAISGPILGGLGAYLGYRVGLEQTIAPQERRFIRRFTAGIFLVAFLFVIILLITIYGGRWLNVSHKALTLALAGVTVSYMLVVMGASYWYSRRIRTMRADLIASDPALVTKAHRSAEQWNFTYRSRWKLFGLPLINVAVGSGPDLKMRTAKGWIAIGPKAYGVLIAMGVIAVAPLSWGVLTVGVITYGGLAMGLYSIGVCAIGWKSIGVLAIAWNAAQGIVAVALRYADAISGLARHVNDPMTERVMKTDRFFAIWETIAQHGSLLYLVALLPMLIYIRRGMKRHSMK